MQKAIVPPPNSTDASAARSFEQARQDRITQAIKPKAVEAAKPVTPPPAEAVKAAEPPKTDAPKVPTVFEKKDVAPPAAAPDVDPVEKMRLPDNASADSVTNFNSLAKVAKERKVLADNLAKELADLRSKSANPAQPNVAEQAEIQRLRDEHKAATDRLAILDIQSHPDFARQYVEPKKAALAAAAEVIAYNEKAVPEMAALLTKPMKEFNAVVSELTKDMNPADASTVMQSLRQARDLHGKEQQALSSSSELRTQLQAKTQLEQKRAFDSVAAEAVPAFAKMEITETMSAEARATALDYNQSVDGIRARAESRAFGKISERDVANMAFKEVAFEHMVKHAIPVLEKHVSAQNGVIAELTAELTKLKGGNGPANLGTQGQPGAVDTSKMSREERTHYFLHGAGRPGAAKA